MEDVIMYSYTVRRETEEVGDEENAVITRTSSIENKKKKL